MSMKYRVYFINHDYYSQEEFDTLEGAIDYGRSTYFEFNVSFNNGIVASWSPFGGLRLREVK